MKKKVIYIQEDACSCGAACIQSIVSYYGGYVPLETVLDDTNTDSLGTNALAMTHALRKYGFAAFGKKIALKEIANRELPVIAHVVKDGLEHFLVIYDIKESEVVTMDPAYGEKTYGREYFESIYDERCIFLIKDSEIPCYKSHKKISEFFSSMTFIKSPFYFLMIILSTIILILSLSTSFHFKILTLVEYPGYVTMLFIIVRLVTLGFSIFKNKLVEFMFEKIDIETIVSFTRHVFALPLKFIKRKKTGQIVKKIDDASFIKDIILRIVLVNFLDILLLFISLATMFFISKIMTMVYLVISILLSILSFLINEKIYKKSRENIRTYDEYTGSLVEYISGIESIKNLNSEEHFLEILSQNLKNYTDSRKRLSSFEKFAHEIKLGIMDIGFIIANLLGYLSMNGTNSFYDIVTVQSLFGVFMSSLENLLDTLYHFARCKAVYRSVSEFSDLEEESLTGKIPSLPFETLKIEGLSYSYDSLHSNIENLNLTIHRGDKILLRGPSGVGKSTFVKCLCGILENYTGKITFNGIDIRQIPKRTLRDHIIYVGQEETLFTATIAENIACGNYDEQKILATLKLTALDDVISERVAGIHTTLLEGGQNLSGGERARTILARALYKEPSIIIIDETLSAVGTDTEDAILKNLFSKDDLTVIYITHREKEKIFKKIVKLKKGK